MRKLLTTIELAERFGLSTVTLRMWRLKGQGPPYIKFGETNKGAVRYDEDKVASWLNDREK